MRRQIAELSAEMKGEQRLSELERRRQHKQESSARRKAHMRGEGTSRDQGEASRHHADDEAEPEIQPRPDGKKAKHNTFAVSLDMYSLSRPHYSFAVLHPQEVRGPDEIQVVEKRCQTLCTVDSGRD